MTKDSGSESSPASILGVVASVLAILAFFGIANWEDLERGSASGSEGEAESVAEVAVGDCVENLVDPIVADCGEAGPETYTYAVRARVTYDSSAYAQYWGHEPYTEIGLEESNEIASCALELGWVLGEKAVEGRAALSVYASDTREVLCVEQVT